MPRMLGNRCAASKPDFAVAKARGLVLRSHKKVSALNQTPEVLHSLQQIPYQSKALRDHRGCAWKMRVERGHYPWRRALVSVAIFRNDEGVAWLVPTVEAVYFSKSPSQRFWQTPNGASSSAV